ncbi:hypothetical protein SAMN05421820_103446 [Pedobacter steynii]|uniref:Uncharacterized protein n=1 Tax=Pedobacter steynii TaxID=430522 RepID=A0A1G9S2Q2_9SPHI|nr:hypothetical protein [Pedobacter steynii]NQX37565.1 hypothetical protein [Pedobacter steynii]SDM29763.1 hypothetical protein SAMN05421820_103446 [Pedobacter steynii]
MRNYSQQLLLFLISAVCFSCTNKELTRKELLSYVQNEDHGLKKVIDGKDGFKIEAYVLKKELLLNYVNRKKSSFDGDSLSYFMLSFSNKGREALGQTVDFDRYAQLVSNLSFNAKQYCVLTSRGDTADLVNSYFMNTYGTGASNNLLIVFKKMEKYSDLELIVSEIGFGEGDKKFLFKKRDIERFNSIKVTD